MLHNVAHVHTSSCFRRSVQACTVFTDAARIATNFKKVAMQGLRNGRVSVRLSHRSTAAAACGAVAAGRRRPPLLCPRGAQQQTRRMPQRLSNDETDGRTRDRYADPASQLF